MATSRKACGAVAKAICELDNESFSKPAEGSADRDSWDKARELLFNVLSRNGYELCAPGSSRIRKKNNVA